MLVVEVQPRAIEKPEVQKAGPLPGFGDIPKIPFFFFYCRRWQASEKTATLFRLNRNSFSYR
jgi:hypothetical protein